MTILAVPGFGDSSRSWRALADSSLGTHHDVQLVDLPGIGAPPTGASATIKAAADHVAALIAAVKPGRPVLLVGHSLGSAVAVEAVRAVNGAVLGLVSLEGNLTTEDGYFSATAAQYETAAGFQVSLLGRVEELVRSGQAPASYRASIEAADPTMLWALGRDAHLLGADDGFGRAFRSVPAPARYLWSSRSTPKATHRYLVTHGLDAARNDEATHWPLEHAADWVVDEIGHFIDERLAR